MKRKLRIAVAGGGFGADFLFHLHPQCEVVAVAALSDNERAKLKNSYRCDMAYESLEALLKDQRVEAVAIFTPAPLHAQHAITCLQHGKHVLCAVPAAMTLEECRDLKEWVKKTGLTYMMAETSYYRQDTISARKFYANGDFGRLIALNAQYHHPGLEQYFFDKQGHSTWRHGLPPMLYSTHCTAFLTGVNNETVKSVSALGWTDGSAYLDNNPYVNRFWNQTGLFHGRSGTVFNVNVSWRGSMIPTERCDWNGERMSFLGPDPLSKKSYLLYHSSNSGQDDAGFAHYHPTVEEYEQPDWWRDTMLPLSLRVDSGHFGSHSFIVNEFIDAVLMERVPDIGIELSLNLTLPGIFAHQSALRDGEQFSVISYDEL